MSNKNYYYNKNRKRNYQSNQVEEKKKSKFKLLWLLAPAYLISLFTYYGVSTGNLGGVKKNATPTTATTTTPTTTSRSTVTTTPKRQLSNLPDNILNWQMESYDTAGVSANFSTWKKLQSTYLSSYNTTGNYVFNYTDGAKQEGYVYNKSFTDAIHKYVYTSGSQSAKYHGVFSLDVKDLFCLSSEQLNQELDYIRVGLTNSLTVDESNMESTVYWLDDSANSQEVSKYFNASNDYIYYFRDDIFDTLHYNYLVISPIFFGGADASVRTEFLEEPGQYITYYCPENVSSINGEKVLGDVTKEVYVDLKDNVKLSQLVNEITATDIFGQPCELILPSGGDETFNTAGLFARTIRVETPNGQQSTLTLNIHVVDYTPTIQGNFEDIIKVNYSSTISKADILSLFTVTDYAGNAEGCTLDIKEKISLDSSLLTSPKTYTLVARDAKGHIAEQTIQVQLVDDVGPIIAYTPTIALTSINSPLSVDQLKEIIIKANNLDVKTIKEIKLTNNDYTANANKLGRYSVAYEIATVDGQIKNGIIDMQTSANTTENLIQDGKNAWDHIVSFFKKVWHWLTFRGWNE